MSTPLDTARTAAMKLSNAALRNDLRTAERDWASFAEFDGWPGGNPWAAHRDAAFARILAIRAELTPARMEKAA